MKVTVLTSSKRGAGDRMCRRRRDAEISGGFGGGGRAARSTCRTA